jgi:hypothetical protein
MPIQAVNTPVITEIEHYLEKGIVLDFPIAGAPAANLGPGTKVTIGTTGTVSATPATGFSHGVVVRRNGSIPGIIDDKAAVLISGHAVVNGVVAAAATVTQFRAVSQAGVNTDGRPTYQNAVVGTGVIHGIALTGGSAGANIEILTLLREVLA